MGNPHVLIVPYPAQGHVIPMMELSLLLVEKGIKVTFLNTDFNHMRVLESLPENVHEMVSMVSVPDGLGPWEDRNDLGKLTKALIRVMPGELEGIIGKINGKLGDDRISCVIADWSGGWILDTAEKIGLKRAAFWPGPAAVLALASYIPKLVDDGIVDSNGRLLKKQMVQLALNMPLITSTNFIWTCIGDPSTQKFVFDVIINNDQSGKKTDWIVCNSSYDLEPGTFALFPDILLPIGPLLASNRLGKSVGYFWKEDSSCLSWLDKQKDNSVIYVAFGSFTVFNNMQFQELALGLELTNRPFLWVVREDNIISPDKSYPEGFKERVHERGITVSWSPQQEVLSHPSISCFVTHCGWNSTIEGIGNGVPFICWPYFSDQFLNQTYICDEWKVGLELRKDENGIVRKEEIKDKVGQLMGDESFKTRAVNLQEKIADGLVMHGRSHENLDKFIEWIKKN